MKKRAMKKRRIIQKTQGAYILMGETANTQENKKYKLIDEPALDMKGHSKAVTTGLRPERREGTKYLKS